MPFIQQLARTILIKEIKETLTLTYPLVVAQTGHVLMGIIDNLMIGPLGASELAAAGISNNIFFTIAVIGIGTLTIISPLVSKARAEKKIEECSRYFNEGLSLSLILSAGMFAALFLVSYFFQMFEQTAEVDGLAREYLMILSFSILPMMVFIAAKNFTDGLSLTKISMQITLMGLVVNIFLNWILIHGYLGFPTLGLNGAGYATLISRVLMAFIVLFYVVKYPKIQQFNRKIYFKLSDKALEIFRIGFPGGLQLLFEVGAFAGAAVIIGWIGTESLAAHQIVISLAGFSYMVCTAIAHAGTVRVGYAFGLKSKAKILIASHAALFITVAFMIVTCLLFILGKDWMPAWFIQDPKTLEIASSLMILAAIYQLSDGIQVTSLGTLRAIQDVKIPTVITLIAYWVIALPCAYLMGVKGEMGSSGIWLGLFFGLTFSAIFQTVRFYTLFLKMKF